jgi:hypothetical protein
MRRRVVGSSTHRGATKVRGQVIASLLLAACGTELRVPGEPSHRGLDAQLAPALHDRGVEIEHLGDRVLA